MKDERTAEAADRWLEDFARASENEQRLDHLVAVIAGRIVEAVPQFLDPALRPGLDASVRGNWKGFLAVVSRDDIEVQSPPQVRDWARDPCPPWLRASGALVVLPRRSTSQLGLHQ